MAKFWHGHHAHNTQRELDVCEAQLIRENTRFAIKFALLLVVIGAVLAAFSCGYAELVYGDWTCGLPTVECRKMVQP